jgi:para-aminobenzoate synthetase component 1
MEPAHRVIARESSLETVLELVAIAARPLVPRVHELGVGGDPVDVAQELGDAWLLASEPLASEVSQHDILGFDPFLELRARADRAEVELAGAVFRGRADPCRVLDRLLEPFRGTTSLAELPCSGGAIGAFAYDLGRSFEELPVLAKTDLDLPWVHLRFHHALLVREVRSGRWYLVESELPPALRGLAVQANLLDRARRALSLATTARSSSLSSEASESRSTFSPEGYAACVARIVEAIHAGDVFQVNLSQRFSGPLKASPHDLFRAMRAQSPVPFSALLPSGDRAILSASPERFLRVRGTRVATWPIKGTVRRGHDARSDAAAREALLGSVKDRAELNMIIDLERNDLGRICRAGSIAVREAARVQSLSSVHHLYGVVEGELVPSLTVGDLLRATFPGGSVTGAPKLAAMQMIERLEPVRRSFYTGAIGYLGFDGALDLNVAIRTVLIESGTAHLQVGGGVVADSEPWKEYEETLAKSEPLMRALGWRLPAPPRR